MFLLRNWQCAVKCRLPPKKLSEKSGFQLVNQALFVESDINMLVIFLKLNSYQRGKMVKAILV